MPSIREDRFVTCTEPEYWEQRYLTNRTPWDMEGVPPVLVEYLEYRKEKGTVLIPGCGSGHEVRVFHELGWQVLAIDFSPAAIARARSLLGGHANALRRADFFADDLGGPFEVIYDRTFLCSLPPAHWPRYVNRMAELLPTHGCLVGLFVYGEESEPPPFPLSRATAATLFGDKFSLTEDCAIPPAQSLPLFAGKERWQVWRRK